MRDQLSATRPPKVVDWIAFILGVFITQVIPWIAPVWRMVLSGMVGGSCVLIVDYVYGAFWSPPVQTKHWIACLWSALFYWIVETATGMYLVRFGGGIVWQFLLLEPLVVGWVVGAYVINRSFPPVRSMLLVGCLVVPMRIVFAFAVARGAGDPLLTPSALTLLLAASLLSLTLACVGAGIARIFPARKIMKDERIH